MESADDSAYSPYAKLSRETPNPLRPYYLPPTVGSTPSNPQSASFKTTTPKPPSAPRGAAPSTSSNRDFRELFSDYGEYLPEASPGVAELAKRLMDQAIYNYTSVLLSQPFEVAKVVLQCHDAGAAAQESTDVAEKRLSVHRQEYIYSDSDSDSEAPSYFMPTSPEETPSNRPSRRHQASRTHSTATSINQLPDPQTSQTIRITNPDSVIEVISQLWSREGAFGVWKGTNSTFIYGVLLKTIETWTRSCLSAILDIPDPTLLSSALGGSGVHGPTILDSPSPIASLGVIISAAVVAGCLLAPIDLVRTRLIITPTSTGPRALLPSLKSLGSIRCPTSLLPITILNSAIPSALSTSLPLFFRSWLKIDPLHTPGAYSVSAFLVSLCELFVKLPLETVLRRGHIAVLSQAASVQSKKRGTPILPLHTAGLSLKLKTIVPAGPYKGVLGSMLYIVYEEGARSPSVLSTPARSSSSQQSIRERRLENKRTQQQRGQGLRGLWRGWRVGFWGIVGMYAAAGLGGSGQAGGEF